MHVHLDEVASLRLFAAEEQYNTQCSWSTGRMAKRERYFISVQVFTFPRCLTVSSLRYYFLMQLLLFCDALRTAYRVLSTQLLLQITHRAYRQHTTKHAAHLPKHHYTRWSARVCTHICCSRNLRCGSAYGVLAKQMIVPTAGDMEHSERASQLHCQLVGVKCVYLGHANAVVCDVSVMLWILNSYCPLGESL